MVATSTSVLLCGVEGRRKRTQRKHQFVHAAMPRESEKNPKNKERAVLGRSGQTQMKARRRLNARKDLLTSRKRVTCPPTPPRFRAIYAADSERIQKNLQLLSDIQSVTSPNSGRGRTWKNRTQKARTKQEKLGGFGVDSSCAFLACFLLEVAGWSVERTWRRA